MIRVALLPGDGVGEEVLDGPSRLLGALAAQGLLEVTGPWPVGARAMAATGSVLPEETLAACDDADALLLGAVGEDPRVPPGVCPRPAGPTTAQSHPLGEQSRAATCWPCA